MSTNSTQHSLNLRALASVLCYTCNPFTTARAQAVVAGTRLQQRPLYSNSQGAPPRNSNLTGSLPSTAFLWVTQSLQRQLADVSKMGHRYCAPRIALRGPYTRRLTQTTPTAPVTSASPFDAQGLASHCSHCKLLILAHMDVARLVTCPAYCESSLRAIATWIS